MATRRYTAVIYWEAADQDIEGVYVAECPEVGAASQGDTVEEALANLKEVTELYLEESRPQSGRSPFVTIFEVEDAEATPSHG